jgi:hypothetical protein
MANLLAWRTGSGAKMWRFVPVVVELARSLAAYRSTQVSGRLGDKCLRHRREIGALHNVLSRTILLLTLERAWKASIKLDLNVESQSQTLELCL